MSLPSKHQVLARGGRHFFKILLLLQVYKIYTTVFVSTCFVLLSLFSSAYTMSSPSNFEFFFFGYFTDMSFISIAMIDLVGRN